MRHLPQKAHADGDRLRQVITNLVGNAIKFTEEGQVEVRVEEKSEGRLLISVADSGIGIPEDRVQAIFEEYSQATTTTTKEYGGTGLGLSISRRLVEMMGGELSVKSTLGKGSTFMVELPAVPMPQVESELFAWSGRRVLVASKTENTNAMLYELLESLGCDPIEAYPDESIADLCERFNEAKAAGRPFGCVILDISRAGTPDSLGELTKLAGSSLRVIMGDVRSMQERKIWEDSGWPQWLLRPVKLQRLKDVLSMINQEHRLDVKNQVPKAIRHEENTSKRADASESTNLE